MTNKKLISDILAASGRRVVSVKKIPGGFNCSVFKVIDSRSQAFIAKKYLIRAGDSTRRLKVEFGSLSFLA